MWFNIKQAVCCRYDVVFNLVHPVPVQCPAISSLQSDWHKKSSHILRLPHTSDKRCTSAFARKGLNLIWVAVGLSSALNTVGCCTSITPQSLQSQYGKHFTRCSSIQWGFWLSKMQHSSELGHYQRQKQKPRAQNFDASSQREIVGISRTSPACSSTATAPPPSR